MDACLTVPAPYVDLSLNPSGSRTRCIFSQHFLHQKPEQQQSPGHATRQTYAVPYVEEVCCWHRGGERLKQTSQLLRQLHQHHDWLASQCPTAKLHVMIYSGRCIAETIFIWEVSDIQCRTLSISCVTVLSCEGCFIVCDSECPCYMKPIPGAAVTPPMTSCYILGVS